MLPIRNFRFNPRSVVDALDGGQIPAGGLSEAKNLIFDPSNPFTFECRPAAVDTFDFTGISDPGVVSVSYVVGDICYGMIASSRNSGRDEPFAYNLETNTLLTVGGTIDATTTPTTPSTSGEWTPPTMAIVGVLLYVTHPGFSGGAGAYFGWFDVTNPASPVWNAGNVGTFPLLAVPTSVQQFSNRAWFAVGSSVAYTDTLANNATNGTQVITIGDDNPIIAQAPVPLATSVQGIIQALAVFKGSYTAIISGDEVQGNLTLNIVSSTVGTYSPRSVTVTPSGVMFAAIDGIRSLIADSSGKGTLQEPEPNLKNPFIFMLNRSRASAAFNNNIYRISLENGHEDGNPIQEYWYDFRNQGWTGPHTFIQNMASSYLDGFVCFSNDNPATLYVSPVVQSGTSTFEENGEDLDWSETTVPMADDGTLFESSAVLSVIDMQLPDDGSVYNFIMSDVNRGVLSTAVIASPSTFDLWDSFDWGDGDWTAVSYGLDRYNIPWQDSMVFSRPVFTAQGPSSLGFKIGKLTVGIQARKYVRIR